jgi:hypothetical protein
VDEAVEGIETGSQGGVRQNEDLSWRGEALQFALETDVRWTRKNDRPMPDRRFARGG